MKDDAALLRSYVDEGSQEAFAEVVRRHVDLVYGAAMRRTNGDPHQSADVAQQVFTTLAREARKLASHPVLPAWLHAATRNAALNLMLSEQRRKTREAQAMALAPAEVSADWDRIRPVLDGAIDELPESDRAAVVMRFLERRPFAQIGAALRLSEDAARMRTERALDKLRLGLARRGITSTAAALSAVVAAQPIMSAPAGLAATTAAQALAASGVLVGGLAAATFIMNTKTIATAALVAGLFFGIGSFVGVKYSEMTQPPPPAAPVIDQGVVTSLRDENVKLVGEISRLNAANATLTSERSALQTAMIAAKKGGPPPALSPAEQKQRQMVNNLRQLAAVRDQFILEHGRSPISILEVVGADKYIRQLNPVDGEDYSNLSMSDESFTVTTADGVPITYKQEVYKPQPETPERQRAKEAGQRVRDLGKKVNPTVRPAIEAFRAANNGKLPSNNEALIPYFNDPQQGADFVEYIEAEKAARAK